jgi:hypothetical protein
VSDRLDLAALLADPVRATEVPAGRRQAVLDALATQEGRCRLVRDRHPRPVRSVGTVQEEEALGDDRDALADIAAKLGYPVLPADCGVSLAPGQASWSQFTEQASADEWAQARAGLERIKEREPGEEG